MASVRSSASSASNGDDEEEEEEDASLREKQSLQPGGAFTVLMPAGGSAAKGTAGGAGWEKNPLKEFSIFAASEASAYAAPLVRISALAACTSHILIIVI